MEKDKEIWKVIPGYSGYEASSHGNIRNSHSSSLIRQKFSYNDCKNYLSVGLYHDHEGYNTRYVHQLVCEAFHGPRPEKDPVKGNYVTNHIDGNKHNNRADNLEWVLHSDNMIHAMQIGLRNDNVDVEIIDVLENKTYKFHSINAATHFLKVDRGVLYYLISETY